MKFKCKFCSISWDLATFAQVDEIQKVQCPNGHPHQCHVLKAVVE